MNRLFFAVALTASLVPAAGCATTLTGRSMDFDEVDGIVRAPSVPESAPRDPKGTLAPVMAKAVR